GQTYQQLQLSVCYSVDGNIIYNHRYNDVLHPSSYPECILCSYLAWNINLYIFCLGNNKKCHYR
ncbi:MAG TPA: hypothetical protein VJ279_08145, partial [Hanamia sp.]|nr:hypothetical protein [Hanamia sp.]